MPVCGAPAPALLQSLIRKDYQGISRLGVVHTVSAP